MGATPPQLQSGYSISWSPSARYPRHPWLVDADIRVAHGGRVYTVQRGFRLPHDSAVACRPDRPGLLLREWLYATHGQADGAQCGREEAEGAAGLQGARGDEGEWRRAFRDAEALGGTAWWRTLPMHAWPVAATQSSALSLLRSPPPDEKII
eukprot:m51a1_g437 hypothetical protein (152) ;mRNA; f:68177-68632